MEKKYSLILDKEFIDYCLLNKIEDVEKFAKEVFVKGFTLTKYGNEPKGFLISREKHREMMTTPEPLMKVTYESTNIQSESPVKLISIGKEDLYDE